MKRLRHTFRSGLLAAVPALLIGCDSRAPATTINPVVLNTDQQSIYETNCKVCHGTPGSGAPQTGNLTEWQERVDRGMDSMLQNAISGYQGMPAMGGCYDCSDDDLKALTAFMVSEN